MRFNIHCHQDEQGRLRARNVAGYAVAYVVPDKLGQLTYLCASCAQGHHVVNTATTDRRDLAWLCGGGCGTDFNAQA